MDLTTDFQELVSQNLDYEFLRNKTLLITGATGMLGRLFNRIFYLFKCREKSKFKDTAYRS